MDCSRQVLLVSIPILYSEQADIENIKLIAAQLIHCWASIAKVSNDNFSKLLFSYLINREVKESLAWSLFNFEK